jgi:O-antigen/teichoic acid export membrane protein
MQPGIKQKDAQPVLVGLLARRFGCMVGAQWGSGLLAGFFVILLARNGPEAFGLITLALALGELTTMLTDAGFESYLVPRFTAERARPRRILAQTLLLQSLLLLLSLGFLAALCPILGYDADKSAIILLVASGMGPGAMARSFFTLCRVRGRQDTEMRIRVPAGLAGSAFGIICLLLNAPLPLVACFKLAETLVLFILIGLSLRWRLGGFPSGIRQWAGRFRGAFLFAGIAVCGLVYNKLNIYVLDQFGGAYALGLYNAPWEIVDGLSVLVSGALIERVMFPLMATQWMNDRPAFMRMTRTAAICLLLLGMGIAYALFVEGDRILCLAFGTEYLAAAGPLRAQLLCIPASFLHNLAACMLISMRLHKPVLLIYISGMICNILLCWGFIPEQGVLGAALAISGTKLWMVLLTMGLAMRLGLAFHPVELGAAALAAALAFGGHALTLPHLPREAAELVGLAPLLLAGCWLLPRMRVWAGNAG